MHWHTHTHTHMQTHRHSQPDTHSHTKERWRLAEEEMNFDPAGHSKVEVKAGLHSCVSLCVCECVSVCVCVCAWYCLFVGVGQGWDNWSLAFAFLPSGLDLVCVCVCVCVFICVDHLVGTVANFSIRHTHTIFSIRPKGQALFIHYCVHSQWVAAPLQPDVQRGW